MTRHLSTGDSKFQLNANEKKRENKLKKIKKKEEKPERGSIPIYSSSVPLQLSTLFFRLLSVDKKAAISKFPCDSR